jgi:thymidylate kinase
MIIEFFGPPSAGKTTLALALADQLRAQGQGVANHFSLRPAEQPHLASPGSRLSLSLVGPTMRRLGRPFWEMLRSAARSSPDRSGVVEDFLGTLPPRSSLWAFRLRQYLLRLEAEWGAAAQDDDIALFDQAYLQFICSLGLLSNQCEPGRLARLVSIRPEPDVLILVDVPRETLERRLQERSRRQSFFERLLEFDMKTNLASVGVIGEIADLLAQQGQSFARIYSVDPSAVQVALESVAARLPQASKAPAFAQMLHSAP